MLRLLRLSVLPLLLAVQSCGGSTSASSAPADASSTDGSSTDAGDAGGPPPFDGGNSGPCFMPFGQGVDAAACLLGSECHPGQVCVVAEGCFCTPRGLCFDDPCDGGLSSTSCAQSLCAPTSPGFVDVDAGTVQCLVEGC